MILNQEAESSDKTKIQDQEINPKKQDRETIPRDELKRQDKRRIKTKVGSRQDADQDKRWIKKRG